MFMLLFQHKNDDGCSKVFDVHRISIRQNTCPVHGIKSISHPHINALYLYMYLRAQTTECIGTG